MRKKFAKVLNWKELDQDELLQVEPTNKEN